MQSWMEWCEYCMCLNDLDHPYLCGSAVYQQSEKVKFGYNQLKRLILIKKPIGNVADLNPRITNIAGTDRNSPKDGALPRRASHTLPARIIITNYQQGKS